MFPACHVANVSGFYRCHRSSGAQIKGAYLIYGLLVMPPALGLVELFRGARDTMRSSVIVLVILTIAAGGHPCLALS
jgi:hypothetical protein